jgi:hypothetical protein
MRGFSLTLGIVVMMLVASAARAEPCDAQSSGRDRIELLRILKAGKEAKDRFDSDWFESADQLDGTHSGEPTPQKVFAQLRTDVDALRCIPKDRQEVRKLIDGAAAKTEALRQKESKCRKSTPCMARRRAIVHAPEVCELLDQRTAIVGSIKEERANPAGVVSLAQLHELGESLQATDDQFRQAKSEFFQQTKVRFDEKMCKELKVDDEGNYVTPVVLDPS